MYSKRRNGITSCAYLQEKEAAFPTKEFIVAIAKDIKNAKQNDPQDSKFRVYGLQHLWAKLILLNLKMDILKEIIKFKHCMNIIDSPNFNDGKIIVIDKHIVFRLDFETKARYSMALDRKGDTVTFSTMPKSAVIKKEQNLDTVKFMERETIQNFTKRLFTNLFNSLSLKAEGDILKEFFGLEQSGKGTFIDGRIIRKRNEVFFEIVIDSKFKFSLIIDLYGNYLEIAPADRSSDWMNLLEESFNNGAFFPAVNLFHSNIDCLL